MAKARKDTADGYQRFKEALKSGAFQRMYVFYGEEDYLIHSCRKAMKKKLIDPLTEDFNYHRFNQENFTIDGFQEAVEALPMMSETTMVEVTDIHFFGFGETERNRMGEIFGDIPDYCTILFVYDAVEWKPDKRYKKLYTAMDGVCSQVAMNRQSERELIPWIRRQLATGKKVIQDDLARYLILQTGGSMTTLAGELQKLINFTDQEEITRYDIDQVVIPVLEAAIFDITRDIGNRDFDGALQKLRELLQQDIEPIAVNAVIGRQMRQMYTAKVLSEGGKGAFDLATLYGLRDFAARQVYEQARGYQKQQLREGCRLSAWTDYQMKTSGGSGEHLLEDMVLRMGQMGGKP